MVGAPGEITSGVGGHANINVVCIRAICLITCHPVFINSCNCSNRGPPGGAVVGGLDHLYAGDVSVHILVIKVSKAVVGNNRISLHRCTKGRSSGSPVDAILRIMRCVGIISRKEPCRNQRVLCNISFAEVHPEIKIIEIIYGDDRRKRQVGGFRCKFPKIPGKLVAIWIIDKLRKGRQRQ